MRTFIILINDAVNSESVKNKIKQQNFYYFLNDTTCFVHSDSTARDLYSVISGYSNNVGVIICEILLEAAENYWGRADKGLWKWLSDRAQEEEAPL